MLSVPSLVMVFEALPAPPAIASWVMPDETDASADALVTPVGVGGASIVNDAPSELLTTVFALPPVELASMFDSGVHVGVGERIVARCLGECVEQERAVVVDGPTVIGPAPVAVTEIAVLSDALALARPRSVALAIATAPISALSPAGLTTAMSTVPAPPTPCSSICPLAGALTVALTTPVPVATTP